MRNKDWKIGRRGRAWTSSEFRQRYNLTPEKLEGFRLRVRFRDGTVGEVRMREFLYHRSCDGTVFEALRDPHLFNQAVVELGAVTWPNGTDMAPDAMYDEICANGSRDVPVD